MILVRRLVYAMLIVIMLTNNYESKALFGNGNKSFNEPCTWQLFGSECKAGYACAMDNSYKWVCKVEIGKPCEKNSDCPFNSSCKLSVCWDPALFADQNKDKNADDTKPKF